MNRDAPAVCPCGSAWFELRSTEAAPHGAVTLDHGGVVTGFAGEPYCIECGARWVPVSQRLRVVSP